MLTPLTKRASRTVRRRGPTVTRPQPTAPITVTDVAVAASVLTVTFDQPVMLNGVPAYTTNIAGATATSAVMTSPTTVAITFSAAIATATEVRIPYEEPAVRNGSGGFVSTSTFPV
jgi:hypothetical protein